MSRIATPDEMRAWLRQREESSTDVDRDELREIGARIERAADGEEWRKDAAARVAGLKRVPKTDHGPG